MKIIDIKESGSNRFLKYLISKKVNLEKNLEYIRRLDDVLSYNVIIDDVTLTDLMLIHLNTGGRVNVKIIEERLSLDDLEGTNENETRVIDATMALHRQMLSDSQSIERGLANLFVPLRSRRFKIITYVSFYSFYNMLTSEDNHLINAIFNTNYPKTLEEAILFDNQYFAKLYHEFAKLTANIEQSYSPKGHAIKNNLHYKTLKSLDKRLYSIGLNHFTYTDPGDSRRYTCDLLGASSEEVDARLLEISSLPNREKKSFTYNFSLRIPIYYVAKLLSEIPFATHDVARMYSFQDVITNFELPSKDTEPIIQGGLVNQLSKYDIRIKEVTYDLLKNISEMLDNPDMYKTNVYSLLPSSTYMNLILQIKGDDAFYSNDYVLQSLFKDLKIQMDNITYEIDYKKYQKVVKE